MSLKVSKSDYWDFKLSKDSDSYLTGIYNGEKLYTNSLVAYINFNDSRCIGENGVIYSVDDYKWDKANNKGLSLKNIGLTGIDNGKIVINEDNYDDVVKNSTLIIKPNDLRLQLTRVGGNTGIYEYPVELSEESDDNIGRVSKLRGGFYQGFFKSGKDYQVLPLYPETEITYEFLLKPEHNAQVEDNILNGIEGYDNDGIFFYVGLRAENKFIYEYANLDEAFDITNDLGKQVMSDTYLNQIAFRFKKDGKIGYRTIIHNCDSVEGYCINEEYSEERVDDINWCLITVRMIKNATNNNFKLLFYADGKLVLTSKELPELKLRKLSVHDELQEGVPYNISLGGGTQGLIDMIGFNEKYETQYALPIEKYFAGSFIGKISQFKIYNNKVTYDKILNNTMYIKNNLKSQVIDPTHYTIYYGTSNHELTEFSQIMTLQNKIEDYNNTVRSVDLNTGTTNNFFIFAIPTYKIISNIKDVSSIFEIKNLKDFYIESIIKIDDNISYKLYTMKNAIPYGTNHKHIITFKI